MKKFLIALVLGGPTTKANAAVWLIGIAFLLTWGPLQAATTYQYVGNPFDAQFGNPAVLPPGISNLTLSMTLAAPLGPNLPIGSVFPSSFVMSDGATTVTEATGFLAIFEVATDHFGVISAWNIFITNPGATNSGDFVNYITTTDVVTFPFIEDLTQYCDLTCIGGGAAGEMIFDSPGNWSVIPIPAAAWLFGSALGLLGWVRRKT